MSYQLRGVERIRRLVQEIRNLLRRIVRGHVVSLFIFLAANPNAKMMMKYTVRSATLAQKNACREGGKRIKPPPRRFFSEDAKCRDCRCPITTDAIGAGSRCAISSNRQQGFPPLGSSIHRPAPCLPALAEWTRSA